MGEKFGRGELKLRDLCCDADELIPDTRLAASDGCSLVSAFCSLLSLVLAAVVAAAAAAAAADSFSICSCSAAVRLRASARSAAFSASASSARCASACLAARRASFSRSFNKATASALQSSSLCTSPLVMLATRRNLASSATCLLAEADCLAIAGACSSVPAGGDDPLLLLLLTFATCVVGRHVRAWRDSGSARGVCFTSRPM